MAYEHLCMYCFEDLQGQAVCPHCGRDSRAAVPQIQMLPGTLVYHDRFLVGRALGQDATGIVYAAFDTKRENKMRLREYLPRDCAERLNDGSVVPAAGLEDQFEKGMRKLRASVEGVEDPKKRHFYFEENGTAYIAQRKTGAAAAAAPAADEDTGSGFKQIGIIVGVAAAVVIIAAIVIVSLVNGALRSSDDVIQNATLAPNSSANLWAPEVTASPTPYVSPTFAALVDPEQSWMDYTYSGDVNQEFQSQLNQSSTATPKPSLEDFVDEGYETVNGKSPSSEVTTLQQRLASLGWLSAEKITGKYDSATKQAVKDFQTYVNNTFQPAEKLSVDGIAGPKTQQWLYATEAVKPTPTPTPAVTANPDDGTVDKDSDKTDIKAVQRKLIVLGLMDAGSDDGVYGTTTVAAVKKFQQRVNQLQGYEALPVTGVVDPDTMAYLNYYVEWWESLQQATATPEPVLPTTPAPTETPEPTDAPTPAPTDAPDQEEDGFHVDADSPKESIQYVQQMMIAAGLLPEGSDDGDYGKATANAMLRFQQYVNEYFGKAILGETGVGDSLTLSYLEEFVSRGMTVPSDEPTQAPTDEPTTAPTDEPTQEPTDEPTQAPTDAPDGSVTPDSSAEEIKHMQQLLISAGVLAEGGDDGDYGSGTANAVKKFQQYVNQYFGEMRLEETGIADANTMKYLEEFVNRGMTVPGDEPTQAPTDEPTQAPAVELNLSIGGTEIVNGVHAITAESITFNWSATGAVSDYYVYVYRLDGSVFYQEEATGRTSGTFGADSLHPNEIYTIRIGALPEGGDASDMVWTEAQFGVYAAQSTDAPTQAPTDAPTQEPTAEPDGSITPDSSVDEIKYLQQMLILAGALSEGSDDGDYGSGTANAVLAFQQYVNQYFGEAVLEETGIADANTMKYLEEFVSRGMTVPGDEPTTEPTAVPDPTDAPEEEGDGSVTPESSAGEIKQLQQLLISAGVLGEGGDDGDYGNGTSNAVMKFQQYVNDYFGEERLEVTGIADASTMKYLEEFVSRGMTVPSDEPTQAPEPDPTEVPEAEPTAEPEPDPTEVPEPTEVPKEFIPVISINNIVYDTDDAEIPAIDVSVPTVFSWECEGDLKGYMLYMTNSANQKKELDNTTESFVELDLSTLPAGAYMLWVGAVPSDAQSEADVIWSAVTFTIAG